VSFLFHGFVSVLIVLMTRTNTRNEKGHRTRVRTLGLPATPERALMGRAYENYATAQDLHVRAHNAYRATLRRAGYDANDANVAKALSRATEAALYLQDAKAQYRAARVAAEQAGRPAA
jgi:hypothetical protein